MRARENYFFWVAGDFIALNKQIDAIVFGGGFITSATRKVFHNLIGEVRESGNLIKPLLPHPYG